MKRLAVSTLALVLGVVLVLGGVSVYLSSSMPDYRDSVGDDNYTEKITGLYLVRQSAAREDNLIIYGSSELRTLDISTHPSNFFRGKRSGFQVNLVGRGSCQSLIHAINVAAAGDDLRGHKVVLITSPQSYVQGGIAPDLFRANFSQLQFQELLRDEGLSPEVKGYLAGRVLELLEAYEAMEGGAPTEPGLRYLAEHAAAPNTMTTARNVMLAPYYGLSRYLDGLEDRVTSRSLIESVMEEPPSLLSAEINWAVEEENAVVEAVSMTSNNEFGMMNDYYTTYIGNRLARQENRDTELSYTVSREYDDLRALFQICREKGVDPLFVHVPLHGEWSDYTGFTLERRQEYYHNVREIVEEYGIEMLDLTGYEYEEFFLCDVMHLGWKGWLEVDRALIDYYYGG